MYNADIAFMEYKSKLETDIFDIYIDQAEKYNNRTCSRYIHAMNILTELAKDMGYTLSHSLEGTTITYAQMEYEATGEVQRYYIFK